ncbi:MAG: sugar ABC transporter ATP-binding protein [Chloroflexi bacterium]|nr:MAG: sugar ABC transporter ATP-binding protein [Chloroflexota bacterium]
MQHSPSSTRIHWPSTRRWTLGLLLWLFTTALALTFMFPFVWTISSSLKTAFEVIAFPPTLLPRAPQWGNYAEAWSYADFGLFFRNSILVSGLGLVGQVISSLIVAYGFARFRFPGREALFVVCLSGMMMPAYVTIIPLFTMFRAIGWTDSFLPLIVPSYFGSAFAIFLLRQFILSIPLDFDESALIDGASRWRILTDILLPNCKPALATVAIVGFMTSWNAFLAPLIFLDSVEKYTLPMGLWFLKGSIDETLPKDHLLMAGAMITTAPVLAVFIAAQNYFVEGVVMSGIKG